MSDKIIITDAALDKRVTDMFEQLEALYPEHKVFAFDSIASELRERISKTSKDIGYESLGDMLNAYGFEQISFEEVKQIRPSVIYAPGEEPPVFKNKVDSVLRRLEEYYPTKKIGKSIQSEHKALGTDISGVYQWLGYADIGSFLTAYGYEYNPQSGGRPKSTNADEIISLLKERSADAPYNSLDELKEANPDIAGKFKTLSNRSKELFGMPFGEYLIQEGIIVVKPKKEDPYADRIRPRIKDTTISPQAVTILNERFKDNNEQKIEDVFELLEGLYVKQGSGQLYIAGTKRSDAVLDIPCCIDYIGSKAFAGKEELTKVILPSTCVRIDSKAFMDCVNLEEVIINNPECKIEAYAFRRCDKVQIKIDRSAIIDNYLSSVDANDRERISECIKTMSACFESVGGRPDGFWAGKQWKFAFTIGDVLYQTPVLPRCGDYREIDQILERVFKFERVRGTITYVNGISSPKPFAGKIVYLDDEGKILREV